MGSEGENELCMCQPQEQSLNRAQRRSQKLPHVALRATGTEGPGSPRAALRPKAMGTKQELVMEELRAWVPGRHGFPGSTGTESTGL